MSAAQQRQVSLWVPEELYEELRRRSFEERRTHTDLITTALTQYLAAEPAASGGAPSP